MDFDPILYRIGHTFSHGYSIRYSLIDFIDTPFRWLISKSGLRDWIAEHQGKNGLLTQPVCAAELWSRVNLEAADYFETNLPDRYLRIRYEDFINDPIETMEKVCELIRIPFPDPHMIRKMVKNPGTIGRFRQYNDEESRLVYKVSEEGLKRFGYLV